LVYEYESRTDGTAAGCSASHAECTKICGKNFNELIDDDTCGAWIREFANRAPVLKSDLDIFITRCDERRTSSSSYWLLGLFITVLGFGMLTIAFCAPLALLWSHLSHTPRTHLFSTRASTASALTANTWPGAVSATQWPTGKPKRAQTQRSGTRRVSVWTRSQANAISKNLRARPMSSRTRTTTFDLGHVVDACTRSEGMCGGSSRPERARVSDARVVHITSIYL
jgi:hypothetical protein